LLELDTNLANNLLDLKFREDPFWLIAMIKSKYFDFFIVNVTFDASLQASNETENH
jgi:hypothetical protein